MFKISLIQKISNTLFLISCKGNISQTKSDKENKALNTNACEDDRELNAH